MGDKIEIGDEVEVVGGDYLVGEVGVVTNLLNPEFFTYDIGVRHRVIRGQGSAYDRTTFSNKDLKIIKKGNVD